MRRFFRIIAWLIVAIALALAARDALLSRGEGKLVLTPLGEDWYNLSADSLNLLQAVTERYLSPALWLDVFQPLVLAQPTFAIVLLFGLLIMLMTALFGRRRRARR